MSCVPYATLIATIMCCVGVGVFCGTTYRGVSYTLHMFNNIFGIDLPWSSLPHWLVTFDSPATLADGLEIVKTSFFVIGGSMGGIALILLLIGFLATGTTREKVYKGWRARMSGRIACALFMFIIYILNLAWLLSLIILTIVTFVCSVFWGVCNTPAVLRMEKCIDFKQFEFFFPNSTHPSQLDLCGPARITPFCKEFVEPAGVMFILATISCFLVVVSMVHYLMCLSANYAHIKDSEKFADLQELQYLHEHGGEMGTLPKERF